MGVRAALVAGMDVVAVSTPLTRDGLRALEGLPEGRLVDDPSALPATVRRAFEERGAVGLNRERPWQHLSQRTWKGNLMKRAIIGLGKMGRT